MAPGSRNECNYVLDKTFVLYAAVTVGVIIFIIFNIFNMLCLGLNR